MLGNHRKGEVFGGKDWLRDRDSDGPIANIASDDGDVIAVDKTFVGLPWLFFDTFKNS